MNKNKPALFVVLALVLIGATLILFSKQDNNGITADGTIKIVLGLSLTGDFSYFGNEVKNAFNLLEKKAKANNIQFIYEDNQSEINRGVTIFNKYASDKSVALFVTNNTPFSAPIRELADRPDFRVWTPFFRINFQIILTNFLNFELKSDNKKFPQFFWRKNSFIYRF